MHIEHARQLATVITRPQPGQPKFNMDDWASKGGYHIPLRNIKRADCGTTCCLAGWACLLFASDSEVQNNSQYTAVARRVLGLTSSQAWRLFYGQFANKDLAYITAEEAATELRRMADEQEAADRELRWQLEQ